MAVNTVSNNYTGRRKDISILQTPDPLITGAQTVIPSFGRIGKFCAGTQKTIQRYAIILLTNITSQEYYPEFGTKFILELSKYSAIDTLRARQLFIAASFEAVSLMQNYQTYNKEIPADERIASANLLDITADTHGVSFSISVKTEAGSAVNFLLPLPK